MPKELSENFEKAFKVLNSKIPNEEIRKQLDELRKGIKPDEVELFDDLYDTVMI